MNHLDIARPPAQNVILMGRDRLVFLMHHSWQTVVCCGVDVGHAASCALKQRKYVALSRTILRPFPLLAGVKEREGKSQNYRTGHFGCAQL